MYQQNPHPHHPQPSSSLPTPPCYSSVTLSSTGDFRFDVVPPDVLTGALLLPLPSAGPLERLFRCFRLRLAFSFTIALNF